MTAFRVRPEIETLEAYAPGLAVAEIRQKYGLAQVIKLASNENPLGVSPLAAAAVREYATMVFRYPQGGNPRLAQALGRLHAVDPARIVVGNGSDEIIDLLIRVLVEPGKHSLACFDPCFSIYPIQGQICGAQVRRCPLNDDFSFDFDGLLRLVDADTRLVFLTTPDNPSGYCPPREAVENFAKTLAARAPHCLLVVDEAYMDFHEDEPATSLLTSNAMPPNAVFLRTLSKSYGLAGLRLGYAVLPTALADFLRRARLPFSVNVLAEEATLAVLNDTAFREATLKAVRDGRKTLREALTALGCTVWPSSANFLLFQLPEGSMSAADCFEGLLQAGIIIRPLKSYNLPAHLRVSVGSEPENRIFITALTELLALGRQGGAA